MTYLEKYLNLIVGRGNPQLAESIRNTVNGIVPNYFENFTFCTHEVGLLFGNVQSGKTGQMFGLISAASDLGFPIFIILTTDNVVLQQQTIERVREDLCGFCICDEYDTEIFAKNNLEMPTIVVLKKNFRTLKQWINILSYTGFIKGNPLFIIDDEADAASLNTLVNKEKKSSINRYLEEMKAMSASSIYLQVTGTPQSLFLQSLQSGWHPYFTYYFAPGMSYLGGDFFFTKDQPECISYIDKMKQPLIDALLHHMLVSAQLLMSGRKVCNFLIHPSVRKSAHKQFENEVTKAIKALQVNYKSETIQKKCKEIYLSIQSVKQELFPFENIINEVKRMLDENVVKVLVMNGDSHISSNEYSQGSNIIIGGNTLGRGVTFPGLQTIYYSRTSKKPQADTMWQHSRMFGYDRVPGLMQVYIDEHLYKLFSDINATNNSIVSQVKRGINKVKIYYPEGINPTRKNVLDTNKLIALFGGTNYYPFSPENDSIEEISKLLVDFDEREPSYQVSLRLLKEVLGHISSEDDFKIQSVIAFIETLLAEKPTGQGVLIVRRGRNVAKGTGALLSPNDWQIGDSINNKVVLTMYQMTGEKGWNGRKLWVPNIKFPEGIVYYDVINNGE